MVQEIVQAFLVVRRPRRYDGGSKEDRVEVQNGLLWARNIIPEFDIGMQKVAKRQRSVVEAS